MWQRGGGRFEFSSPHPKPNLVPRHCQGTYRDGHLHSPPILPSGFNQTGEREMPQITLGPPCQADGAGGRGKDGAGDALTYGAV